LALALNTLGVRHLEKRVTTVVEMVGARGWSVTGLSRFSQLPAGLALVDREPQFLVDFARSCSDPTRQQNPREMAHACR
jgi:hypothetical protein